MKEQKGITLIALVITIIVLLILAGVTIAMLTGSNGILTNSNKANCENSYRSADEQMRLAYMSVRTQIMAETVANSVYSPSKDADDLCQIVRDDLGWNGNSAGTGNKFYSITAVADSANTEKAGDSDPEKTACKKIVIKYKDNAIDQNLISSGVPKNDTYVVGEIYLGTQANQSASYKYDTTVQNAD